MASKSIREQIRDWQEGTQQKLAELMDEIYQREFTGVWPEDPSYDLLADAKVEGDVVLGPSFYMGRIAKAEYEKLETLRSQANGWFYQEGGVIVFASPLTEWERVKAGFIVEKAGHLGS